MVFIKWLHQVLGVVYKRAQAISMTKVGDNMVRRFISAIFAAGICFPALAASDLESGLDELGCGLNSSNI